ncbi:MAG: hypothetical protein AB1861_08510 [Cyanobacteriota bacterium]
MSYVPTSNFWLDVCKCDRPNNFVNQQAGFGFGYLSDCDDCDRDA